MSGSDYAGDLLHPAPSSAQAAARRRADERMPWPGAAILILLLCAGLWAGIGMAFAHFFG